MHKFVLALTASAFIFAYGATAAPAQVMPESAQPQTQEGSGGSQGYPGWQHHGRWQMMRGGMMGQGMMGNPIMMRMIFALMDTDGDGRISLQEFQAAHERIFKTMDSNKDGHLTLEEMQTFILGTATGAPR